MSEPSQRARAFFADLVDAVRYSQAWTRSLEEQKALGERYEKQLGQLDGLASAISAAFDGLELDREYAEPLSKVVVEFAATAIKQQREKMDAALKVQMQESSSASEAERLKALRSLESYLATAPLPVTDEEVRLELSDGSYTATAEYRCAGEIVYEFLLSTAESPLFRSGFALSLLRKGIRLPVRLGKAWLRKESVPDFERLDGYLLSTARASENHLVAKFVSQETGASIGIVFSRSGEDSFVTAEYADAKGKVGITEEPALSKHLDLAEIKEVMGKLLDAIVRLKRDKLKLNGLEARGNDVLATLDLLGFMQQVTALLSQSPELLEDVRRLDQKAARDRLKLLGPAGAAIADSFGIPLRAPRPRQTNA